MAVFEELRVERGFKGLGGAAGPAALLQDVRGEERSAVRRHFGRGADKRRTLEDSAVGADVERRGLDRGEHDAQRVGGSRQLRAQRLGQLAGGGSAPAEADGGLPGRAAASAQFQVSSFKFPQKPISRLSEKSPDYFTINTKNVFFASTANCADCP